MHAMSYYYSTMSTWQHVTAPLAGPLPLIALSLLKPHPTVHNIRVESFTSTPTPRIASRTTVVYNNQYVIDT